MGGGGGAAIPGGGGGGGGGAPGAPELGIGGGGGALALGIGGAGGGELKPGEAMAGEVGVEPEPIPAAERGRGGPMVPKRIDARWRAPPAPGPSSSDESSSLSESTTDQSSSSGRTREGRLPVA